MLQVKIVNDGTGTPESGNYKYSVLVNGEVIQSGEITAHPRITGWKPLVRAVTYAPGSAMPEVLCGAA